ncbi:hypothetical protein ACTFIU_007571 [Dictyostelium citrinum]
MAITNYAFVTGSTLSSPCDIPRVSLLVYPSPTVAYSVASGAIENTSDLFSITLCKYYLNSVVSLSASNAFGGVAHYTNLTTLMNNLDTAADTILNALYTSINSCSTFTNLTTTRFSQFVTDFTGYRTTILSLQTSCNTLKTAVTTTRDSFTLTTDIYTTVKNCYTNVINALDGLSNRLGTIASLLNNHTPYFQSFKDTVDDYNSSQGAQDPADYMAAMNSYFVNYLMSSNSIFTKIYFYKRLRVNSDIIVNYNTQKKYNTPDGCGTLAIPCTSLEDAGNRVILENKNGIGNFNISIIGNINGSTSASFGNLYSYCGTLEIRSYDSEQPITIDGSNSNTPFINIKEDQYENCLVEKIITIRNLNFINWDQTILNININQETNQNLSSPSISITFTFVTMNSLSSIISIYPINVGEIFNYNLIRVSFSSSSVEKLKSSSTLFAPNSNIDYLAPIYAVGATIRNIPSIKDSNFTTTPFIYLNQGRFNPSLPSKITNNSFCYPFVILNNNSNIDMSTSLITLDNNKITTVLFISNTKFPSGEGMTFGKLYHGNFNNTPTLAATCPNNKQYLGNKFNDNSFILVKDCINWGFETGIQSSTPLSFSIFNSNTELNSYLDNRFDYNIVNSTVKFLFDVSLSKSTITGSDSTMYLENNKTICSCPGCQYYVQYEKVNSTNCNAPTETPTTTGVDTTKEPQPSSSSSSSSSNPKSNSIRNIVIIIVILGSASVASLVLFSIIYKRHKNKKYILNSISSSTTMSEEDNDLAGAAADNDVSPNLEPTAYYEDDNCAQLEQI